MTLIINGKERDILIIKKNIYKYQGTWQAKNMVNAAAHNANFRGSSLGTFNDDYAERVKNGSFTDMWVGDYFTINNHIYKIAGFNYKCNHEENLGLGNHLIMLTGIVDQHAMNTSNSSAGGFAGSDMFRQEIPVVEKQLATDFGEHLLKFKSYLSTSIDSTGAPNYGQWFELTACLCNSAMWWGAPSQYSNNENGTKYNIGDEDTQLPIMKLHTDEQKSGGQWVWLRDVYISSAFADADSGGSEHWTAASGYGGVRAFFLID
jgi:hypothetical protein